MIERRHYKAEKRYKEERMQMACIKWFDLQYPEYSPMMHHSPNGGYRNSTEGCIFKAMGVRAGFPDLIFPVARQGYNALAIEFKTDKGAQSPKQKEWQLLAHKHNIQYEIVRDFETFMNVVNEYLE